MYFSSNPIAVLTIWSKLALQSEKQRCAVFIAW